jgi:divalent metal cation (Fe/Co/Zn/Cd) transporter
LTLITENPLIQSPHNLRTRRIGPNISIEVHVRVDAEMTVRASHQLTIEIEQRLREVYGPATLVSIHVEPTKS